MGYEGSGLNCVGEYKCLKMKIQEIGENCPINDYIIILILLLLIKTMIYAI
jgi:hypothetical protein